MKKLASMVALALLLLSHAPARAADIEFGECMAVATVDRCVTSLVNLAQEAPAMLIPAQLGLNFGSAPVDQMRAMTISMGVLAGYMVAVAPLTGTAVVAAILGGVASAVLYDYSRELRP